MKTQEMQDTAIRLGAAQESIRIHGILNDAIEEISNTKEKDAKYASGWIAALSYVNNKL